METTNKEKKTNKALLFGGIGLAVCVAVFAVLFLLFGPKTTKGSKQITIDVVNKAQETTSYNLRTDAEFLRQAMDDADGLTYSGSEGDYGMMVDTVNGERADYTKDNAYWSFYVNGEYCNYGIDEQPVNDKDAFRIEYTPAN